MKRIFLLFTFLVGTAAFSATSNNNAPYPHTSEAVIFVEGGVEFAVYPDGQFDFFYNPRRNGYNINVVSPNLNISFNSGYNYDPYIQYDDFGAVIQIERVPVYYDYYGRIIRAGNTTLSYNSFGMLHRIGNLYLHYNPYRQYTHATGFINHTNRRFVARPWHKFYTRPQSRVAVVYSNPYRAYYHPNRLSYNNYRKQAKKQKSYSRSFYRPGDDVKTFSRGTRTAEARNLSQEEQNGVRSNKTATRSSSSFNPVRSNSSSQDDKIRSTVQGRKPVAQSATRDSRSTALRSPDRSRVQGTSTSPAAKESQRQSRSRAVSKAQEKDRSEATGVRAVRQSTSAKSSAVERSTASQEQLSRSRSNAKNSTVRSTSTSKAPARASSRAARERN